MAVATILKSVQTSSVILALPKNVPAAAVKSNSSAMTLQMVCGILKL